MGRRRSTVFLAYAILVLAAIEQNEAQKDSFKGRVNSYVGWGHPPNLMENLEEEEAYLEFLLSSEQRQGDSSVDSIEIAWVSHYASGLAPAHDMATAVAVDSSGNIYVTGYSPNLPFGVDYFTLKYSSSGEQIWTARYDGVGKGDDFASAICVDTSENVYVTGRSWSPVSGYDYTTVKYNSAGEEQWVAHYDGGGNSLDGAMALAADALGNVYVTGYSIGSDIWYGYDYATVKYNWNGVEQWVARYDGLGSWNEVAVDVAVDGLGSVYVTGYSEGIGTKKDFATIKYSPDGIQEWTARYDRMQYSDDKATALVVDGMGNICLTGYSVGSGTGKDYATVKYDSDGIQQWVAHYDGPANGDDVAADIKIDGSGDVYVTGESRGPGTEYDYSTVKYSSDGVRQWVARYNGPGFSDDKATGMAVDDSGMVYVTGSSEGSDTGSDYVTIKYDSDGVQQWKAHYDGPANGDDVAVGIAFDGLGGVCVGGYGQGSGTAEDYITVKYNSEGGQEWMRCYDGPSNADDVASDIAIDSSGNVYVTGYSEGSSTKKDYATVKYDRDGIQQWIARYNGPGNHYDQPYDLVVDGSGNAYITGKSKNSDLRYEYATVKYGPDGIQRWVTHYHGPGMLEDEATAIAVDDSGNVYVTGTSWGSSSCFDYATIKYDSEVIQRWVTRYDGPGNSCDGANALALDYFGNIYVTGKSSGSGPFCDYGTVKYRSDGDMEWAVLFNGPGNGSDEANAIAVDDSGHVYVTGYTSCSDGDKDYATIKYSPDGILEWMACYDGPGYSSDVATGLGIDASGNVYVTGYSGAHGPWQGYDYATVKYTAYGEQEWVARYNGPASNDDVATAMVVDDLGNVYVTGYSMGLGTWYDFATVKYSPNGNQEWVARHNAAGRSSDVATALAVDESNNVYVTGYCEGSQWRMYSTVKYVQPSISHGLKGDVDGDRSINILDVMAAVRHILEIQILSGGAFWRADCNGDGLISVPDVLGIVNVILGTGTCEP